MTPETPLPPAGWYPTGDGRQAWWDGARWSDAPPQYPSGHPTSPMPAATASYGPPGSPYGGPGPMGYGMVQTPYGMVPAQSVAPKNPALMLLASFFVPGLGTMLNGEVGKGVCILVGYVVSWILTIVIVGIFGLVAFWVWGLVDAYQGAQRWNARYGILS